MPSLLFEKATFLVAAVTTFGLSASGCEEIEHEPPADDTALRAEAALPSPRIDRVSLSGSGCPDFRELFISGDRSTFFAELDNFVVAVSPESPQAELDCTVSVTLSGADGVAYSPAGMHLEVTTDSSSQIGLATAATWTSSASPSVSTNPLAPTRGRNTTITAFDEPGLWSACTGARELQLTTKLKVRNDGNRYGYGAIQALSDLQFRARACTASPAEDAGVDAQVDGGETATDGSITMADPIIRSVSVNGTGCSDATSSILLADDKKSLEVSFNALNARAQSGRFCVVQIDLAPPSGYRADIASYVLEGQMQLPASTQALLNGQFAYTDEPPKSAGKMTEFIGPRTGPYQTDVLFPDVRFTGNCLASTLLLTLSTAVVRDDPVLTPSIEVKRLHSVKFKLRPCL